VGVFSLSLLGTFLVRSGVLVSVHSFASDPARGIFILSFLALMIGGALTPVCVACARSGLLRRFRNRLARVLPAVQQHPAGRGRRRRLWRHARAADRGHAQARDTVVGPPYFNPSFLVPTLPLVMLVSIGIHSRWRRGALGESRRRILGALAAALLIGLAVTYGFYGGASLLTPVGAVVGFWIILSSLIDPIDRLRRHLTLPASVLGHDHRAHRPGMFRAGHHLRKIQYDRNGRGAGAWGQPAGRWLHVRYNGGGTSRARTSTAFGGHVTALRNGKVVAELSPEKRHYFVQGSGHDRGGDCAKWNAICSPRWVGRVQ